MSKENLAKFKQLSTDKLVDLALTYGEMVTYAEKAMNSASVILEKRGTSIEEELNKREQNETKT